MPKPVVSVWKTSARWSAAEARAALTSLDASGLSLAAFAKREGLVAERLYSWRRRLADQPDSSPEFVEVMSPRSPSRYAEIVFPSGVTLRVAETIEPTTLRRLVEALERGC
jgi:transposase-like protein